MSKIINVFIDSKWFGSFSNKKNAFNAIASNVDISDLVLINKNNTSFLPASYQLLVSLLKEKDYGKCVGFFRKMDVELYNEDTPIKPLVQVLQCECNMAINGVIYKSGEESESSE